jgi:uncharacterized phage protein (TIGR02220 family)
MQHSVKLLDGRVFKMARSRNIKPGFYKNEDLAECSIWARFIFPGLWMLADREGRLEDRPKRIKGELLPFDNADVAPLLDELSRFGFIVRYEVDGLSFIQIVKFLQHQAPHVREKASTIPAQSDSVQSTTKAVTSTNLGGGMSSPRSPDSLFSDSLLPITTLSGKPDDIAPKNPKQKNNGAECASILEYLNEKSGSNFKPVASNLNLIQARLNEGATAGEIKRVIDAKVIDWKKDSKMVKYLRPATLFNATNFAQYAGQASNENQNSELGSYV